MKFLNTVISYCISFRYKKVIYSIGISVCLLIRAAYTLGSDRSEKMENENWQIRYHAVRGISVSDVEGKINFLRGVINDENPQVRRAVVKELEFIGDDTTIPPLTEILNNDPQSTIRVMALNVLIGLGQPAVSSIGGALNDENEEIRFKALKNILIQNQETLIEYLPSVVNDSSKKLRKLAVDNLHKIAVELSTGATRNHLIENMGDAINDDRKEIRLLAIEKIANLKDPDSIPILVRGLESEDKKTKLKIVKALGKIGTSGIVEPLARFLSEEEIELKIAGIEILKNIDTGQSLEVIADFIRDEDYKVRRRVINILSVRGNDTVIDNLKIILSSEPNYNLRKNAVYALGSIATREAGEAVHLALKDDNSEVKKAAAAVLRTLGFPESVDPLGELLLKDRYLITEVCKAFKEIGDRKALEYLLEILPDKKGKNKQVVEETIESIIKVNR